MVLCDEMVGCNESFHVTKKSFFLFLQAYMFGICRSNGIPEEKGFNKDLSTG